MASTVSGASGDGTLEKGDCCSQEQPGQQERHDRSALSKLVRLNATSFAWCEHGVAHDHHSQRLLGTCEAWTAPPTGDDQAMSFVLHVGEVQHKLNSGLV